MRRFAVVARGDGDLRQIAAAFVAVVILARGYVAHYCLLVFHSYHPPKFIVNVSFALLAVKNTCTT